MAFRGDMRYSDPRSNIVPPQRKHTRGVSTQLATTHIKSSRRHYHGMWCFRTILQRKARGSEQKAPVLRFYLENNTRYSPHLESPRRVRLLDLTWALCLVMLSACSNRLPSRPSLYLSPNELSYRTRARHGVFVGRFKGGRERVTIANSNRVTCQRKDA